MATDKDNRRVFQTGSQRDDRTGKGRFDLIPWSVIHDIARHFEEGAKKYGDNNWQKGQPLSSYFDSAMRHLVQVAEGKTNENHLIAAIWNLMAFSWTAQQIQEGNLPAELADFGAYGQKEAETLSEAIKQAVPDFTFFDTRQVAFPHVANLGSGQAKTPTTVWTPWVRTFFEGG